MPPLILTSPFKAVPVSCIDRTSNAFWTATSGGNTSWNGSSWDISQISSNLNTWIVAGAGWESGFRPSSVDITYFAGPIINSDDWDFILYDQSDTVIGSVTGVSNGPGLFVVNVPLTFGALDIGGSFALEINSFVYSTTERIDTICFNP